MKKIRMIVTLCLCIAMLFSLTGMTAFAAENTTCSDLPEDAVIIAQDDNVIFYRSESQAIEDGISPRSTNYAYAWVNASAAQSGTFYITKNFSGTAHITFKVESQNAGAYAQMTLRYKNGSYITTGTPRASDTTDLVLATTISSKTDYQIDYLCYNNTSGMRLMCWFWN